MATKYDNPYWARSSDVHIQEVAVEDRSLGARSVHVTAYWLASFDGSVHSNAGGRVFTMSTGSAVGMTAELAMAEIRVILLREGIQLRS